MRANKWNFEWNRTLGLDHSIGISSSSSYGRASPKAGSQAAAMTFAALSAASAKAAAPFAASSTAKALLAASLDAASFGAGEADFSRRLSLTLWRLSIDERDSEEEIPDAETEVGGSGIADVEADAAGVDEDATVTAVDDEPLEGSIGEQIKDEARSGRPRDRLVGSRPPRWLPLSQVMFGKRRR